MTLGKLVGEMVLPFCLICIGQARHLFVFVDQEGFFLFFSWHDCSLPLFFYWVNFAYSFDTHFSLLWDRWHIGDSCELGLAPFLIFVFLFVQVFIIWDQRTSAHFSFPDGVGGRGGRGWKLWARSTIEWGSGNCYFSLGEDHSYFVSMLKIKPAMCKRQSENDHS